MAIFGISAHHNGDMSEEFLRCGKACTGYTKEENPSVHVNFRQLGTEDVVFIKAFTPQTGLTVKAIGVVTSCGITKGNLGRCVPVQWIWKGEKLIENIDDKCPFRNDIIYEEYNPWVQREIMDLLPGGYGCLPPDL